MTVGVMVGDWTDGDNPTVGSGFGYISSGGVVLLVQTMINQGLPGFNPIAEDGEYGPATENAIKQWQAYQRISQDGVVGPQTWGTFYGYMGVGYDNGRCYVFHWEPDTEKGIYFRYYDNDNRTWSFEYGSNWIYMDSQKYKYDLYNVPEPIY
jgi:hypothetical protein